MATVIRTADKYAGKSMVHAALPLKGITGLSAESDENILIKRRKGQQFVIMSYEAQVDTTVAPGATGAAEFALLRPQTEGTMTVDILPPCFAVAPVGSTVRAHRQVHFDNLRIVLPEGNDLVINASGSVAAVTSTIPIPGAIHMMTVSVDGYWEDADRYGRDSQVFGSHIQAAGTATTEAITSLSPRHYVLVERLYFSGLPLGNDGQFKTGWNVLGTGNALTRAGIEWNARQTEVHHHIEEYLETKMCGGAGEHFCMEMTADFGQATDSASAQAVCWVQGRHVLSSRTDGIT